jgi:hypothetical protein
MTQFTLFGDGLAIAEQGIDLAARCYHQTNEEK